MEHPKTGEKSFFNQIQLHHVSCLDSEVKDSLLSLFSPEDLPRNVFYGDGSPIEEEVVQEIRQIYQEEQQSFSWQEGDMLLLALHMGEILIQENEKRWLQWGN